MAESQYMRGGRTCPAAMGFSFAAGTTDGALSIINVAVSRPNFRAIISQARQHGKKPSSGAVPWQVSRFFWPCMFGSCRACMHAAHF